MTLLFLKLFLTKEGVPFFFFFSLSRCIKDAFISYILDATNLRRSLGYLQGEIEAIFPSAKQLSEK